MCVWRCGEVVAFAPQRSGLGSRWLPFIAADAGCAPQCAPQLHRGRLLVNNRTTPRPALHRDISLDPGLLACTPKHQSDSLSGIELGDQPRSAPSARALPVHLLRLRPAPGKVKACAVASGMGLLVRCRGGSTKRSIKRHGRVMTERPSGNVKNRTKHDRR